MKKLNPYLIFDGNCREAMNFYKECLNGEINKMQTYSESPIQMPDEASERIFDSEMQAEDVIIKASDNMPNATTEVGKNFALFIAFSDGEEMKTVFGKLADGGNITFPLDENFGMLTDKFGIQWMLAGGQN